MQTEQTETSLDDIVERLTSEGLISMAAAARMYGSSRGGRSPHPSTPSRHAALGITLPSGERVFLESLVVGGRRMTSRAAVLWFFRRQQPTPSTSLQPALRSPAQRTPEAARVDAQLDAVLA